MFVLTILLGMGINLTAASVVIMFVVVFASSLALY